MKRRSGADKEPNSLISAKDVIPENEVVIQCTTGTWSMRLAPVAKSVDDLKFEPTPTHIITKKRMKEFLDDCVAEHNDLVRHGLNSPLVSIAVDDTYIYRAVLMKKREKEMAAKDKVLVLDTETTGFEIDDEVLQLSVIRADGKEEYNQYFKPDHKESWENAEKVNHISPESTKDKPLIADHKEEIEKMLRDAKLIVGYNTGFDIKMLEQSGITVPKDKKYVDLMIPFAKVKGEINQYGKPKWQKLITCAKEYGYPIESEDWHNSLGDTKATLYCYNKMKEKGHITEKDIHDPEHLVGYNKKENDRVMGKTEARGIHRRKDSCKMER